MAEPDPLRRSFARSSREERQGVCFGLLMAVAGGAYLVASRAAALTGFGPDDLTFLRFAAAGVVLSPIVLRDRLMRLTGIGWRRGLALTLVGGPVFSLLQTGGYNFAPLAHGAILAP